MDQFLLDLIDKKYWDEHYTPVYEEVPFYVPIKKHFSVSICTTCMGRLDDLKQTLVQNMEDNKDYPLVEFVLLNYNSKDPLNEWVYDNLAGYMESGLLNYYHTSDPQTYSMSHSRNVAFKLAQGDIVNSVDADHFTGPGFAERINTMANFTGKSNVVFVKSRQRNRGRLGMFRKRFMALGGYDESITGYGYEDHDLMMRAAKGGCRVFRFNKYCTVTEDHTRHPTDNFVEKDWRYTQRRNAMLSLLNVMSGKYVANSGKSWGKAYATKNFKKRVLV